MENLSGVIKLFCRFSILAVFCGAVSAAPLTIVADGKPRHVILLDERADEVEHYAAMELQKYLAQMTGSTLPIAARALYHAFGKLPGVSQIAWAV